MDIWMSGWMSGWMNGLVRIGTFKNFRVSNFRKLCHINLSSKTTVFPPTAYHVNKRFSSIVLSADNAYSVREVYHIVGVGGYTKIIIIF